MTKDKLNSLAAKYWKTYSKDNEAGKLEMIDEGMEAADIDELCQYMDDAASADGKKAKVAPKSQKDEKPSTMQWYDHFLAKIVREEKYNPYTEKNVSIIIGWELGSKKGPDKKVEPSAAKLINQFANGAETHHYTELLLQKGKYKAGEIFPYKEWAKMCLIKEQIAKDPNLLKYPEVETE